MGALCTGEGSTWLPWYFALTGVLMAALGLNAWWHRARWDALAFAGMAAFFAALAVWARVRTVRARRMERKD
jgi:hypothetical protein